MKRALLLIPLLGFAALAVFLWDGLSLDPGEIPSALIDKPVPVFDLPPVQGRPADSGLKSADFETGQGPVLLNVFASWCAPCRVEHPVLMDLAQQGVTIHALNYKDKPEAAARFLGQLGDPFRRAGADESGRVAIDFGVYGVPETFVISGEGRILYKHAGPLTDYEIDNEIKPLLGIK